MIDPPNVRSRDVAVGGEAKSRKNEAKERKLGYPVLRRSRGNDDPRIDFDGRRVGEVGDGLFVVSRG